MAVIIVLLILLNYFENKQSDQGGSIHFYSFEKQGELTFSKADGARIKTIDIEIADTVNKTILGLMFRNKMLETQGMLFLFDNQEPRSFWMKDTYIPLDIMFIDSEHRIVSIAENTTPFSVDGYASKGPAQYVVETVAGFSRKYGVKAGCKIEWQRTQN